MAKFLNTDLLNEWIPRLIEETERELVIIVPYINTSSRIYNHLLRANERGVETTLVYRENKLSAQEKNKLLGLSNLNLLHHPNVHAKCYYNESYLIICSMNLYEYSERNNREMGVLLHNVDVDDERGMVVDNDQDQIFQDAILEIRSIINGAQLEKKSRETIEDGFEMEIIKTHQEKEEDFCKMLNKVFINKRFKPVDDNGNWISACPNYFDRVDVNIRHRIEIVFNADKVWFQRLMTNAEPETGEFRFDGFKLYWVASANMVTLYRNRAHAMWNDESEEKAWAFTKDKIDELFTVLRPHMPKK